MEAPLKRLLRSELFAETVEYLPSAQGSVVSSLTARVIRTNPIITEESNKGRKHDYAFRIKVLSDDADTEFGGIDQPVLGDTWNIALKKDGDLIPGWKTGTPKPFQGGWEVPVSLVVYDRHGGKRI